MQLYRVGQERINRFREVTAFLKSSNFPEVCRVDKTKRKNTSPYTLDEVFPPVWINFGTTGEGLDWGILNSGLVVSFIGASEPYKEGIQLGYTSKGRKLAVSLARVVIEEYNSSLVVSGGAFGIDRASHKGALEAGGKTVAVVQNPVIYGLSPKGKNKLAKRLWAEIPANGGFVSVKDEYKRPTFRRAIERNYLTSALSDIVVVIECAEGSGTIDNALKAILQGRKLVVIDWSQIAGENESLRTGNSWLLKQNISHRDAPYKLPQNKAQTPSELADLFKEYLAQQTEKRGLLH